MQRLMCLGRCTAVVKRGLLSVPESRRVIITITEKYNSEQPRLLYTRLQATDIIHKLDFQYVYVGVHTPCVFLLKDSKKNTMNVERISC